MEETPKPIRLMSEDKSLKLEYSVGINSANNLIQVFCRLSVNRNFFLPEEYPTIRNFFTELMAKQNTVLVLKKK